MAAHLGTEHTDRIVRPEAGEMGRRIGALLDEPNGDSSCLPTYLLSGLARQSVTVALSGDGGDELFGGYTRYFATLADQDRQRAGDPGFAAWRPGPAYYSTRLLVFPEPHLVELMAEVPPGLAARLAALRQGLDQDPRPLINRLRAADAADYLPGAVLAKVDRMSMQHALEVRAPLLGRDVAAFAMGLAARDCADATAGKAVLKTLARRYLPAGWVDRPKRGFGLPMRAWGEQTVLDTVTTLLRPGENRLAAWLGQPALNRFLDRQRQRPWMYQLWAVLILESWLRSHPARPSGSVRNCCPTPD
jgi:asparagine synthase (glutamine-hydrolysing)